MRIPNIILPKYCVILVALALLAVAPVAAADETLSANPNSVSFSWYVLTQSGVVTQNVQISGTTSVASVSCTDPGLAAPLFQSAFSGTTVTLSVNRNVQTYATSYNGTCTVTGVGGGTVAIPVSYTINNSTSSTLTFSPASVQFNAPYAGATPFPTTVPLSITSSGAQISFSVTGPDWLYITPTSSTTPATLQIQARVQSVAQTYTGNITITPSIGSAQNIPVTYAVGTVAGNLYVSPTTLSFSWNTGQAAPAAQQVYVQTNTGAAAYTVYAAQSWIHPSTTSQSFVAGTGTFNVTVDPNDATLNAGVNNGTIIVYDSSGLNSQTIQVSLNKNGSTGTVYATPSSLNFSYTPGSTYYPSQQTVTITGLGNNLTATPYSYGNWLTVTQTGPYVMVNVNPAGLAASTYSGTIFVQSTALSPPQTISVPVTFTVGTGGGGGTVAGPTSLTFYAQEGKDSPAPQSIAVAGAYGSSFTAAATTSSGGNWLVLNAMGGVTPATIGVSANTAGLPAGTYYGNVSISSGYGSIPVQVTLIVASTQVLFANPGNIAVNYQAGSSTYPGVQQLNLTSSGSTQITYTATSSTSWLQVVNGSGTTPATLQMIINVGGLPAGPNTGYINVAAGGAANSTFSIPVVVNVYGTQAITTTPTSLTFNTTTGSSPANQTLTLNTDVQTTYTATANSSGWLSISPTSGYTPGSITVQVSSASLSAAQYTGSIYITAGGYTQTVPVTLNVGGGAVGTLSASPLSLNFDYMQGDAAPAAKDVQVSSSGASLNFTATSAVTTGSGWLSINKSSGATPSTVSVSVNPSALSPGNYNGTVTIASQGASGSPQTISVALTVRTAPNLAVSQNLVQYTYRTNASVPSGQSVRVTSTASDLGFSTMTSAPWLSVTPSSGTTPADITINVNPVGLSPNRYTGTVTINATGGRTSTQTVDVVLVVAAPLPTTTGIVHAASAAAGPLAPGQSFTIAGEDMGPAEMVRFNPEGADAYPTTLSDVKVRVNGILAPLVYVSAKEVRAVAPYRLDGAKEANVQVDYKGSRSNTMTMNAVAAAPGIFTADSTGTGPAGALNADGTSNSAANPATRGTTITLYITGAGQTDPNGEDGKISRADANAAPKPILAVTATVDGLPANVSYAGAAPGQIAGMTQVKIDIPLTAGTGNVPVVVKVGTASTQSGVTLAVK